MTSTANPGPASTAPVSRMGSTLMFAADGARAAVS